MGNKAYRDRHKAKGLCTCCSRKAHAHYTRCPECQYKHNESQKRYYQRNKDFLVKKERIRKQKRIDSGECRSCGNVLDRGIDEGSTECQNCRERDRS